MDVTINVDIVIMGGGIAGLWLLNRLQQSGYNCVLLERDTLGGGQSIASQGMIHGGIKYALGGALTGSSEAIAAMPDHWRRCLAGNGDVDLRGATVLSEHFFLWSTANPGSRLTSFFASKLTRGRVDPVLPAQRPPIFSDPRFRGQLYRLADLVLDVPSVVRTLAGQQPGRVYRIDWNRARFETGSGRDAQSERSAANDGKPAVAGLLLDTNDGAIRLRAQRYIFTAGSGNAELLAAAGADRPAMQLRPLHQVLVRHDYPDPLYAHCMGANPSPRLTISSHRGSDGRWVWYLGGDLATSGVALEPPQLIERAKAELKTLLPWVDLGRTEWATLRIDRAEPRQKGLVKPDQAYAAHARGAANVIAAWPTKLTLAPHLADAVLALLVEDAIAPCHAEEPQAMAALPPPSVATPYWETLFDQR